MLDEMDNESNIKKQILEKLMAEMDLSMLQDVKSGMPTDESAMTESKGLEGMEGMEASTDMNADGMGETEDLDAQEMELQAKLDEIRKKKQMMG